MSPGPHLGGRGVSGPTPKGVSRPTPGGCIPACTEADPHPPPHTQLTATAAGGTHPTGMYSCFLKFWKDFQSDIYYCIITLVLLCNEYDHQWGSQDFQDEGRQSLSMGRKPIITVRKQSCRKVMFSQVSVILFMGSPHVTITHDAFGHGYIPPSPHTLPLALYTILSLLPTSGGHHWIPVQTCSLVHSPSLVLTSSGGMHATGMLSCLTVFCRTPHENERNWTGARVPSALPLDPSMII